MQFKGHTQVQSSHPTGTRGVRGHFSWSPRAFSACCLLPQLVIGLYLFDSQETSWLILFEVFIGIGGRRKGVAASPASCPPFFPDCFQILLCIACSKASHSLLFDGYGVFVLAVGLRSSAISAWKLTKAVRIERRETFPFVKFAFTESYSESKTKDFDRTAITYASIALAPCVCTCVLATGALSRMQSEGGPTAGCYYSGHVCLCFGWTSHDARVFF